MEPNPCAREEEQTRRAPRTPPCPLPFPFWFSQRAHTSSSRISPPLFFFLCLCVLQDVETIQSLGEALTKFDGACVIVSHDEKLLRVACTQLWHCDGEGGVVQLHYGFSEYVLIA